jgi:hypothetical protein
VGLSLSENLDYLLDQSSALEVTPNLHDAADDTIGPEIVSLISVQDKCPFFQSGIRLRVGPTEIDIFHLPGRSIYVPP